MQASKESCSRTRLIVQIIDSRNQAIALKTLNERYRDFSPTIHWIFVLLPNVISNSLVHCLGHERAYRIRSFCSHSKWPAGWDSRRYELRSQPVVRAAPICSSRSPSLFLYRRCRLQSASLTPKSVVSADVTFTVWFRSVQCIEQDVQVADHGHKECVVNADMIRNRPLNKRQNCTTHDSHIQNAGCISRQRPKLGHSKTKDAREHDGVEESNCKNAPHGDVPAG